MTANLHAFEGEQLTVGEVATRVPALSMSTIRKYLAEGRNTRQSMLAYNPDLARNAGGRRGAAKTNLRSTIQTDATQKRDLLREKKKAQDREHNRRRATAMKATIHE